MSNVLNVVATCRQIHSVWKQGEIGWSLFGCVYLALQCFIIGTILWAANALHGRIYQEEVQLKQPMEVSWRITSKSGAEYLDVRSTGKTAEEKSVWGYTTIQYVDNVPCLKQWVEHVCVGWGKPGQDGHGTTKSVEVSQAEWQRLSVGQVMEHKTITTIIRPKSWW